MEVDWNTVRLPEKQDNKKKSAEICVFFCGNLRELFKAVQKKILPQQEEGFNQLNYPLTMFFYSLIGALITPRYLPIQ